MYARTDGGAGIGGVVEQLVYSWRILVGLTRTVADIPAALLPAIALSRARGRTSLWRKYGYASPLESITRDQADQLREVFDGESGDEWTVHIAYEFRQPLLADVLSSIPSDEPVFVVPMCAADSAFTHNLSRMTVREMGRQGVEVLPPIDVDRLAAISADHVLDYVGRRDLRRTALVLAAHGTLLQPARPIETGLLATEALRCRIEQILSPHFAVVVKGWLNHSRGGRWTEPPMDETLQRLSDAGFTEVVYYPYGFLADNAESQLEGRMFAELQPNLRVRFVPCLNDAASLAVAIADQIAARERPASLQDPTRVPA